VRSYVYLCRALTSLSHMVEHASCDIHRSACECDQLQRNNYRYSLPAVTATDRQGVRSNTQWFSIAFIWWSNAGRYTDRVRPTLIAFHFRLRSSHFLVACFIMTVRVCSGNAKSIVESTRQSLKAPHWRDQKGFTHTCTTRNTDKNWP